MTKNLSIAALSLTAFALTGCAVMETRKVSEPTLEPRSSNARLDSQGVLHYQDLEISLTPGTTRTTSVTIGLIVPIIPLIGVDGEPSTRGPNGEMVKIKDLPLRIVLKFSTVGTSYSVNPKTIMLHYQNKAISPVSLNGPAPKKEDLDSLNWDIGHKWHCGLKYSSAMNADIDKRFPLNGSGCIVLEYPVTGITADETFSLSLDGFNKDGEPLHLPKVIFRPANKLKMGTTPVSS